MRKLVDPLLVALYVALAALPALALAFGIRGRPVSGSLAPAPLPTPTVGSILSERFQTGFVAWFESNLGFKGNSVAYDNALLYRGFRETKPGSVVRIGTDALLFIDEDINYYNKHGADLPTPEHVEDLVTRIAALQIRLAAEHRALVPILIPSKTTVWREHVSAGWTLPLGEPRPSDIAVYQAFKTALDRHHVTYVDMRASFAASTAPRTQLWGADARHWSTDGACLAMQAITREVATLIGRDIPYDCPPTTIVGRRTSHDDFDLLRTLNAWWVRPAVREVPAVTHAPGAATAWHPRLLLVGTSFCWQLLRDAQDSGRFSEVHMNFYNKTFIP